MNNTVYNIGDVVRFRNKLYPTWDQELFLIERVYHDEGAINYGARPLIPVDRLNELKASGQINAEAGTRAMLIHDHEVCSR